MKGRRRRGVKERVAGGEEERSKGEVSRRRAVKETLAGGCEEVKGRRRGVKEM